MSEFEAIFGDPARPQQVDALNQLEVVDATDVVVAEGPTGIGKSRIAMMHAMYMLEKTPSLHRIIYACHTKKLQSQLARDARRWSLNEVPAFCQEAYDDRFPEVTCVFGTANYWCDALLHKTIQNETGSSDAKAKALFAQLSQVDTMNRSFYDVPPEEHFQEMCGACGIEDPERRERLWSRIACSKRCNCYDEVRQRIYESRLHTHHSTDSAAMLQAIEPFLECPYARSRLLARMSSIVIVNSHYLFTSLSTHNETAFKPSRDYLILDEAHSLADGPVTRYCEEKLPLNLNVVEINQVLRRWKQYGVTRVVLTIANDTQLLEEGMFQQLAETMSSSKRGPTQLPPFRLPVVVDSLRKRIRIRANVPRLHAWLHVIKTVIRIETIVWKALQPRTHKRGREDEPADDIPPKTKLEAAYSTERHVFTSEIMEPLKYERLLETVPAPLWTLPGDKRDPRVVAWLRDAKKSILARQLEQEEETHRIPELLNMLRTLANTQDVFTKEVKEELKQVLRVLDAIQLARQACDRNVWVEDGATKPIAPGATPEGISYDVTPHMVRDAFDELLWSHSEMGVLMMSATLTSAEFSDTDPFRCFRREVGLSEDSDRVVHYLRFPEAFDRTRVNIVSPWMHHHYQHERIHRDPHFAEGYLLEQQHHILTHLQSLEAHKSALILSGSLSETETMRERLLPLHSSRMHFSYRAGDSTFRQFEADPDARAIIYGADGLTTGVDLPGRVGLVVILKPFNERPKTHVFDYQQRILGDSNDEMWSMYWYKRDRIHAQAAGRIQRCSTDQGTLLILSDKYEHREDGRERGSAYRLRRLWNLE